MESDKFPVPGPLLMIMVPTEQLWDGRIISSWPTQSRAVERKSHLEMAARLGRQLLTQAWSEIALAG